jgi:hypothetical protein
MTADVVGGACNGFGDARIAFEGQRAAKYCDRQPSLGKKTKQAPDANPAAKFVHGLESKVSLSGGDATAWRFCESQFGSIVAVRNRIFRPFFIVDRELYGDARAARPASLRTIVGVTYEIPWIGG